MRTESADFACWHWQRWSFDGSDREVIERILHELMTLFELSPTDGRLTIRLEEMCSKPITVRTGLKSDGEDFCWRVAQGKEDELDRAAVHRLFKLHLYEMLREKFALKAAPWGILHGVRPTKIAHRWLDNGADGAAVIQRLRDDYGASGAKAKLLTEVALRQRPFLAKVSPRVIGVYVGIPFCLSRCLYCSFPAYVLPPKEQLKKFMKVFRRDLRAAGATVRELGFEVESIYIGGGTPTALPDVLFAETMTLIRENFGGNNLREFTVEAGRPDSMSAAKIAAMKKNGVTRVSVNPQTMQKATLALIGRAHTPEDILTMYANLRAEGGWAINMDVILGLPGETHQDVADTMQKIIALAPDDITLHALALKKGSRLKLALDEKSQSRAELSSPSGIIALPDDDEMRRMSDVALKLVGEAGFRPYYLYRQGYMRGQLENIGCAKAGAESVYNIQIMEERQTILGVGCAAVTKVVDPVSHRLKSSFNPKDFIIYQRDIDFYVGRRAKLLREVYGGDR